MDCPTTLLYKHTGETIEIARPKIVKFNESTGDGVSWAHWTCNPITGCLHDCDYCYARVIALRFTNAFPNKFEPLFLPHRIAAITNTKIPAKHADNPAARRVFMCSMSDMFGRWVPAWWIEQILAAERAHPRWEYLHLTKFPSRYAELDLPATAWPGTSIDSRARMRIARRAYRRVGKVKGTWASFEPLLELPDPEDLGDLSMFDWIVIGAQTETRQPGGVVPAFAPPLDWVLALTDAAHKSGAAVHWKPNLEMVDGIKELGYWLDEYPAAMAVA